MDRFIYQQPEWPAFRWDQGRLAPSLAAVRHKQGRLLGHMEALGFGLRAEASLQALTEEAVKSSDIEGEVLDREQVRSSLARRLGIDIGVDLPAERHVEGIADMMLDATRHYDRPLTAERLFGWQAALFPFGRSDLKKIVTGAWRDEKSEPMQVVSGPPHRERIHFEAPAASTLTHEMDAFLRWFNHDDGTEPVLRAGIAHLWFVTVHPFEDGNGRIARALTDMALARSEHSAQRFYSMSAQIRKERRGYYDILESTQKSGLEITPWLIWFLDCLGRAIEGAATVMESVLAKAHFWNAHADAILNARQRLVLNRLLDGFEGKLTSSKWARLAKCSQDTAGRDIADLMKQGILTKDAAGGRSTSYSLALLHKAKAIPPP